MGIFDEKADAEKVAREFARVTGENAVLRQAIVLLISQTNDRRKLLAELKRDTAVLKGRAHEAYAHPLTELAMQDTLDAIRRMSGEG